MDGSVFPLKRYLNKVICIHSDCRVLARYAHSPRLRRHFHNKSFEVRSVPPIITTIPRPSDLRKLIEDSLDGHDSETDNSDLLEKIISAAQRKFFWNGCSAQAPVHCECALVHHFLTVPLDQSVPLPMDYLGVSTLSCGACARFIEASNEHSNRKFYTRGCHGNWYFPWASPPSDQQVSSTFRDIMSGYIADMLVQDGTARRRRLPESGCAPTNPESATDKDDTYEASYAVVNPGLERNMASVDING